MRAAGSALLVGSIPLGSAEEVFQTTARALSHRVRRFPDGETGPRSDWIVWQYPVLNAGPEFEVCPPGDHPYRSLPRLRLRQPQLAGSLSFGPLGYAAAARASYHAFAELKRRGVIPEDARFQVSLPTPLSPISAFISREDQPAIEPLYEQRMLDEVAEIVGNIPHTQLAIQWDANFEFALLDGGLPAWFSDVRAGVIERLLRLASHIPPQVELGYHLCHGHDRRHLPHGRDVRTQVQVANVLAAGLNRPLNWLHLPLPTHRLDPADYESLALLNLDANTELYLGVISAEDGEAGARARMSLAQRYVHDFGVATVCGWGRTGHDRVALLIDLHARLTRPVPPTKPAPAFQWPAGFRRVPQEPWVSTPLDESAQSYDRVNAHSWYANLDPTVAQLANLLTGGGVLVDYSGGTGILLDRLKQHLFGSGVGAVVVDSSPKYLRVALEKFRADPAVAFRCLRYVRDQGRLQRLDEVLEPPLADHGVDVIASTNAIHLYRDLAGTVGSWARTLKPGGTVLINSGNIRNPRARQHEWILDETVWVVGDLTEGIVRTDDTYRSYRPSLDDSPRMKEHATFRDRVFLEPRPLSFYTEALEQAGLVIHDVHESSIQVVVADWYEFLCAYHDAILGWVGGTERIDHQPPSPEAVRDRLRLIRQAVDLLFGHRETFQACWTYITCATQ